MKEYDKSSGILEEFKLFLADCTTGFLFIEKHQEVTLLNGPLFLLCLRLALHFLKRQFRLLIGGSKQYHYFVGIIQCQMLFFCSNKRFWRHLIVHKCRHLMGDGAQWITDGLTGAGKWLRIWCQKLRCIVNVLLLKHIVTL